jgi:hypothetical protein
VLAKPVGRTARQLPRQHSGCSSFGGRLAECFRLSLFVEAHNGCFVAGAPRHSSPDSDAIQDDSFRLCTEGEPTERLDWAWNCKNRMRSKRVSIARE